MTTSVAPAAFLTTRAHFYRDIDGKEFVLTQPIRYYSAVLGREIEVYAGFGTDFASIPWFAQSFIQVNNETIFAAIVHDFCCVHRDDMFITQKTADLILDEALGVCQARTTKRKAMFIAVRGYQRLKARFED